MGEGAYCVMHQCGVSMGKLCMPCERLFCMNEIKYSSLKKNLIYAWRSVPLCASTLVGVYSTRGAVSG